MAGKYDEAKTTAGRYEEIFGKGNSSSRSRTTAWSPTSRPRGAVPDGARPRHSADRDQRQPLRREDDSRAHEILLCVQTAGSMNDPNRFKFDTQEFYIKSADEMHDSSRTTRTSAPAPCSSSTAAT